MRGPWCSCSQFAAPPLKRLRRIAPRFPRLIRGCGARRLERYQRIARRPRNIGTRAGLPLKRIDQSEFLGVLLHDRQNFLSEQADVGHPILEADRPLRREVSEHTWPQRLENPPNLRKHRLGRARYYRHALDRLGIAAVNRGLGFFDARLAALQTLLGAHLLLSRHLAALCASKLFGAYTQRTAATTAHRPRESTGCLL